MSEKTYTGTYLILSLKWSDGKDYLVFWGPDNGGYTSDIDAAGRYTAEQIMKSPDYYDNNDSTRAVSLYSVMEGFLGPVRRSVFATYNAPVRIETCHICKGDIRLHPKAAPLTCRHCEGYACDICYDADYCAERAEVDDVRRTSTESRA